MKILVVVPNLGAGGTERVVSRLTAAWADSGHDVTIVTIDPSEPDFYAVDRRVERVTIGPSSRVVERSIGRLSRVFGLRRFFTAAKPDVIVSFITVVNMLSIVAASGLRLPIVVTERLDPREHRISRFVKTVRDTLYRRAAAIVVQTEDVGVWASARYGQRIVHVIPNPVPPATHVRPADAPAQHRVIGVGRLVPQKGFDLLLHAFASCVRDRPGWTLDIVGEGPERSSLEAGARALKMTERVRFVGRVADPEALLVRADIFALSSRYEGFPNALAEAMACGLAVLAFDCRSGPRELIRDGVDGVLVPPGDAAALARELGRLMDDDELRARLGSRAVEVTERFHPARIEQIWSNLLASAAER